MVVVDIREVATNERLEAERREWLVELWYRNKLIPKTKFDKSDIKDASIYLRFSLASDFSINLIRFEGLHNSEMSISDFAYNQNVNELKLINDLTEMLEGIARNTDYLENLNLFIKPACVELKRIRNLCKKTPANGGYKGINKSELADFLGIPVITFQKWEAGKQEPPPYIIKLMEFYLKYYSFIASRENEIDNDLLYCIDVKE